MPKHKKNKIIICPQNRLLIASEQDSMLGADFHRYLTA